MMIKMLGLPTVSFQKPSNIIPPTGMHFLQAGNTKIMSTIDL